MKRVVVLVLLAAAIAQAGDRRLDTTQLIIATYNVEFLFDGVKPEGRAKFPWKGDPGKAAEHMKKVAEVIRELDADILALQEVEDLDVLRTLNRKHLKSMRYKAYLVEGKDTYTQQDCGLLTRIDPEEALWRTDSRAQDTQGRSRGVSKHWCGVFPVNGRELLLISMHLISRRSESNAYRDAQAKILAQVAREESKGRDVVILGDFNCYDGDALDRNGNQPTSRAVGILKDYDAEQAGKEMVNVAERLPRPARYTSWYDWDRDGAWDSVELSSLDHILLSRELARRVHSVWIAQDGRASKASDHYPVAARIGFGGR